jgi:hypothetical protein
MTMHKRFLPFVVVAAALPVAGAAAFAVSDDSNPPGAGSVQVTAVEPAAKDALQVLERHRVASDALPADAARKMDEHASFGMNPELSRLSIGNATNSVYVIPGRDHVCVSLTVGGGANVSCPATDAVARGESGATTVILETRDIAIYGIVPDGVDSVSVQTGSTGSVDVSVEDNAYYTVVPAGTRLRTVGYVGPSGPVEYPIYDPMLAVGQE